MDEILELLKDLKYEFIDLELYQEATVLILLSGDVESAARVARRKIDEFDLVPDPIVRSSWTSPLFH